ncbi:membrane protein [Marmoricola endophyticus]|uniref:Membrane protein n=1 Tax=Marmoricola endophyticus TaxID=2040280 RepID=A0A917F4I2_9ACTN|nr:YitT family protein [Marmoricola endophyticus]GGF49700.1 membrane protein [Marmoricola endophyticus]
MPTSETVPHSRVEDVLGVLTGTFVASFGLALLSPVGAVTGGTAGLSLLVSYLLPLPFGAVFALVNLPFLALALWQKGSSFTVRSVLSVALVSAFSLVHPRLLDLGDVEPAYAILTGNLLVGIGLLIVFRHGSSLGGFNVVALLAQERLGWRAGYVQLGLDICVVLLALTVAAPGLVLLSAVGAAVLNLVLALNHRPGRYLGA